MHWFLKIFIVPLLEALRPATIVEVGVELGTVTKPLLEWAQQNEAVVHCIDPNPKLEVDELEAAHLGLLHFHRARSLEVLSTIAGVDLALIDGDHNWYTVINELRLLQRRAEHDERPQPLILLHDIGWPYGRRDLYYEPRDIPVTHRQPHARLGILPGRVELVQLGINDHLDNAQLDGTPANGVLTAVEDFIAESPHSWRFCSIPGLSGLGVLLSSELYEANEAVRTLLQDVEDPQFLRAQCEAIENARLQSEVRRAGLRHELANASPDATALRLQGELETQQEELDRARQERTDLTYALARIHVRTPGAHAWERELEQRGQEAFLDAYLAKLPPPAPGHAERDPLSLPLPTDRHGLLCATAETQEPGQVSVDVVVCVHNALEDVRCCLCSLLESTQRRFRLILVDDGSEQPTKDLLADLATRHPAITLIHRSEPPHGYTLAANAGLRASSSDYVVLLNSDTLLTPGWLQRLIEHGERHPRVGILGPLSNAASHQSVPLLRDARGWAVNPLPDWLTEEGMALIVERGAPRVDARLPFINGFCYAIKREVIESVGLFDEERFAAGYCEENDYSHRAFKQGFELGVVDDAYVHHAKSRSFGTAGRNDLAKRHYQAFLDKHDRAEVQELVRAMEADTTLAPVRQAVQVHSSCPAAFGLLLTRDERPALDIVFILPGIAEGGSGGSHSIYQEVSGMRALGIPARIAIHSKGWERAQDVYPDAEEVFEVFSDIDELAAITAGADVISATHFKSVALLCELRQRREDFLPAYYVQDYEPFFAAPGSEDLLEAAASYTALPDMVLFAKTHWLCNVVGARHGVAVNRVQPSIDERLFRPDPEPEAEQEVQPIEQPAQEHDMQPAEQPAQEDQRVRIVAMVRPRTPRRQPFSTLAVLERLLAEFPDQVRVSTFGCQHLELARLTRSRALLEGHLGVLSREAVAQELRDADVFLDMSMYQAFGRSALEAMACGCTAVVPEIGGAWEFVQDGVNALAVDTLDPGAAYEALASLVGDRTLLAGMKREARETGSRFSIARAVISEYLMLERHHRQRFGVDAERAGAGEGQAVPVTVP